MNGGKFNGCLVMQYIIYRSGIGRHGQSETRMLGIAMSLCAQAENGTPQHIPLQTCDNSVEMTNAPLTMPPASSTHLRFATTFFNSSDTTDYPRWYTSRQGEPSSPVLVACRPSSDGSAYAISKNILLAKCSAQQRLAYKISSK